MPSGCLVLQGQLERRREGDKGGGMGRRGRVDKEEERKGGDKGGRERSGGKWRGGRGEKGEGGLRGGE